MKNKKAEQNWWSALSNWLVKYQGRADYLFVYDGKHGKLDRCFDRNVSLRNVDDATISRLYQAAAEGRLGLLRPKDLKPQLLTADPAKMFSSGKEVYVAREEPEQQEQAQTRQQEQEREQLQQQEQEQEQTRQQETSEEKEEKKAEREDPALNDWRVDRAAADPAVAERLRAAEAVYRQVVYAVPPKPVTPPPTEVSGDGKAPVEVSGDGKGPEAEQQEQFANLERAVEAVRNAVPLQLDEGFERQQEQLITDLAQMVLNFSQPEQKETEQQERKRKAQEELVAAQNLFIWAAASEKRDEQEFEVRMELLDLREQLLEEMRSYYRQWQQQMQDMSRKLFDMDKAGASEQECNEKIREYLDGKTPEKQPEEAKTEEEAQQEIPPISGEMWGNTLRHFSRFAAGEVPLSIRHVQVAKHCQKILREAAEHGIGADGLGLDPQEMAAVKGTIEMGKLVQRGLLAQEKLTSGHRFTGKEYRACLRNFLAMKGIEEALVPHVQAHEAEIGAGDGPVSAMQILMAHKGFRADDLREKTEKTNALNQLERMDRQQVARMIRQGGGELAALGQQVMVACYQMGSAPQAEPRHAPQPKAPQVSGPQL